METYHQRGRGRGRGYESQRGHFPRARGGVFERGRGRGHRGRGDQGSWADYGEERGNYRGGHFKYRDNRDAPSERGKYTHQQYDQDKPDYRDKHSERYEADYQHREPRQFSDRRGRRSHSRERSYEYRHERSNSREQFSRESSETSYSHKGNSIEREYKRILKRDRSRSFSRERSRSQSSDRARERTRDRSRSPSRNSRNNKRFKERSWESPEREFDKSHRRTSDSRSPSDWQNTKGSYRPNLDQDEGLYGTDRETSEIIKNTFSEFSEGKTKKRYGIATRDRRSSEKSSDEDRTYKKGPLRAASVTESNDSVESGRKSVIRITEGSSEIFRDKGRLEEMAKDISIKISVANPEAKLLEERHHRPPEVFQRSSTKNSDKRKGTLDQKSSLFGALPDLFENSKTKEDEHPELDSKPRRSKSRDSVQKERISAIPGLDCVNDVDDEEEFLYGDLLPMKNLGEKKLKDQKQETIRGSSEMEWEMNEPPVSTSHAHVRKEEVHSRKHLEVPCEASDQPVKPDITMYEPLHQSAHSLQTPTQQYQREHNLPLHLSRQPVVQTSHTVSAPSAPDRTFPPATGQPLILSVSSIPHQSVASGKVSGAESLESIQQANLLSAIHQPGFMDAVNRGRGGDRITMSDLLAAANLQNRPCSTSIQQYSAHQLATNSTQLGVNKYLSSEHREEPEKPPKPELSKDKTIENILKSIGYNIEPSKTIELSKIMQERDKHEDGMKQSVDTFGIKEGSSFLHGGLKNVDIQSVFDKKDMAKPKQNVVIPEESYEERARRYMEEQKRSISGSGSDVSKEQTQSSVYGPDHYQSDTAGSHGVECLREAYEEKYEPSTYEDYQDDVYSYGDQYDYENRQFMEMQTQNQRVSHNIVFGGANAHPELESYPSKGEHVVIGGTNTRPDVESRPSKAEHEYYSPAVAKKDDARKQHEAHVRESHTSYIHRTEPEKPIRREEKLYSSYPDPETKTSLRASAAESHGYEQVKRDYSRERSLEKRERIETFSRETRDSKFAGHYEHGIPSRSPAVERKDRFLGEDSVFQPRELDKKIDSKTKKTDLNDQKPVKSRYRIKDKEEDQKEYYDYSPERTVKRSRLEHDESFSAESIERQLLEVNVQDKNEERPHQRRVVMMKTSNDTDDLLSSSQEHRRTVVAQSTRTEKTKERMTHEQHNRLIKEMNERKKKLGKLEQELEFLCQEQAELKQRSQRDGNRDKMMKENSKIQSEISKQITYLRRAVDDNVKKLNSVEIYSPKRESTPKQKVKGSLISQRRPSVERSKAREIKSPECEETRKIFVDKKRKLESYPESRASPEKREKSPRREDHGNRKAKKVEPESCPKEEFKKVTHHVKRSLRVQEKEKVPKVEDKYVNKRFQLYFDYFDGGDHWCSSCHHSSPTIDSCLDHIESKRHVKRSENYDKPWQKQFPEKKFPPNVQPVKVPFKGVEFLRSCQAFYCSMCNVFSGDKTHALEHLKSDQHNQKYKIFCEENPGYEKKLNLDKTAAVSIKKDLKHKKFAKKSKHSKKKSKRKSREKETVPNTIKFRVGKAKVLPTAKVASSSSSSSSDSSGSGSSSSSSDSSSESESTVPGFKKIMPAKKGPEKGKGGKAGSSTQADAKEEAKRQPFKFQLKGPTPVMKGGKINVKLPAASESKYKPKEPAPQPPPEEPEIIVRKKPSKPTDKKVAEVNPNIHQIQEEDNKEVDMFVKMKNVASAKLAEKKISETVVEHRIMTKEDSKTLELFLEMESNIAKTTSSVSLPLVTEARPAVVSEKSISPPVVSASAIASAFAPSSKKLETPKEHKQTEEMKMLGLDPSDSTLALIPPVPPPLVLPRNESTKSSKERKSFMSSSNAAKLYNIFHGCTDKKDVGDKKVPSDSLSNIPMPPMKQWQKPKPKPKPTVTVASSDQTSGDTSGSNLNQQASITDVPIQPPVSIQPMDLPVISLPTQTLIHTDCEKQQSDNVTALKPVTVTTSEAVSTGKDILPAVPSVPESMSQVMKQQDIMVPAPSVSENVAQIITGPETFTAPSVSENVTKIITRPETFTSPSISEGVTKVMKQQDTMAPVPSESESVTQVMTGPETFTSPSVSESVTQVMRQQETFVPSVTQSVSQVTPMHETFVPATTAQKSASQVMTRQEPVTCVSESMEKVMLSKEGLLPTPSISANVSEDVPVDTQCTSKNLDVQDEGVEETTQSVSTRSPVTDTGIDMDSQMSSSQRNISISHMNQAASSQAPKTRENIVIESSCQVDSTNLIGNFVAMNPVTVSKDNEPINSEDCGKVEDSKMSSSPDLQNVELSEKSDTGFAESLSKDNKLTDTACTNQSFPELNFGLQVTNSMGVMKSDGDQQSSVANRKENQSLNTKEEMEKHNVSGSQTSDLMEATQLQSTKEVVNQGPDDVPVSSVVTGQTQPSNAVVESAQTSQLHISGSVEVKVDPIVSSQGRVKDIPIKLDSKRERESSVQNLEADRTVPSPVGSNQVQKQGPEKVMSLHAGEPITAMVTDIVQTTDSTIDADVEHKASRDPTESGTGEGNIDKADSTAATSAVVQSPTDDAPDFLEIVPNPPTDAAKSPKRGSGRGRPRGKRGRGRGRGRGARYRTQNRRESSHSDESAEQDGKQMEGVDTESVGEQSGGKWKAVDSVSVTSSQAVTLEDIARRAEDSNDSENLGVEVLDSVRVASSQAVTEDVIRGEASDPESQDLMPGFELLDECSEN